MNLHNEIMNLQTKHDNRAGAIAYKTGHRDARHAAAELAIASDAYIERLEYYARKMWGDEMLQEIKAEAGV
jgi:hypothetical protein